jgi:hypothetical protein
MNKVIIKQILWWRISSAKKYSDLSASGQIEGQKYCYWQFIKNAYSFFIKICHLRIFLNYLYLELILRYEIALECKKSKAMSVICKTTNDNLRIILQKGLPWLQKANLKCHAHYCHACKNVNR